MIRMLVSSRTSQRQAGRADAANVGGIDGAPGDGIGSAGLTRC